MPAVASGDCEPQTSTSPLNIKVICEGNTKTLRELTKLKCDGKACVMQFIQKANKYIEARNLSAEKLLAFSSKILVGDALHWFRDAKNHAPSWKEVETIESRFCN